MGTERSGIEDHRDCYPDGWISGDAIGVGRPIVYTGEFI